MNDQNVYREDASRFVNDYTNKILGKYDTSYAQEHAYRIPLEELLKSLVKDIKVINDPKQVAHSIRPDFIIFSGKKHDILGGYIEAKDIDKNLDIVEKSDQLAKKYLPALSDLILTNYLEFRRYINGEKVETIIIGKLDKTKKKIYFDESKFESLTNLLVDFIEQPADKTIESADLLSSRLASKCLLLKEQIIIAKGHEQEVFERENPSIKVMKTGNKIGPIFDFYKSYRKMLTGDIKDEEYADNLAQTFIYSLFSARLLVPDNELKDFSFKTALEYLPSTVPFLHSLYSKMQQFRRMKDIENIEWVLSDLTSILRQADMESVLTGFGKLTRKEDPIVHFYEGFLKAYDQGLRKDRGVWYTPKPVVKYIVNSIDHILRERFGKKKGFADKDVIILDPACGTGTFLAEVVEKCKQEIDEGVWHKFVRENLLGRLFGFEIMVAPYTISHLKLALTLTHYDQEKYSIETLNKHLPRKRINIVLTNTLEEPSHKLDLSDPDATPLEKEAGLADSIKRDEKVMVILGNPPYSVSTQNKNEWIDNELMEEYKKDVRSERNIQPLSDDYIKFIRFTHWRITRTGHGIVGMITNNSYLSGLIHRGMRKSLLKDFDQMHIINLHGNSLLKETTPDGGTDQNVFDIRQGVSISINERYENHNDNKEATVWYSDLWGKQNDKYKYLESMDIEKTRKNDAFEKLHLSSDNKFFVKKDFSKLEEYEKFVSIREIVPISAAGFKTHRDKFVISFEEQELQRRFIEIEQSNDLDYLKRKYGVKETKYWNFKDTQKKIREVADNSLKTSVHYRPFDTRFIYYNCNIIERSRWELMKHMLLPNIALIGKRARMINTNTFQHISISSTLVDGNFHADQSYCFPLYLYLNKDANSPWDKTEMQVEVTYGLEKPETQTVWRVPNLSPEIVSEFEKKLGLKFITDGKGDLKKSFGPEDILSYIYAILHSPTYRSRFEEFLKIDFPKIPIIDNPKVFYELIKLGEKLIELHLMKANLPDKPQQKISFKGISKNKEADCLVEKIRFEKDRVYINKEQYFEPVSKETWEFMVGGYQVCHKWLKDRTNRKHDDGRFWSLTEDEIDHYKYIVYALGLTRELMKNIDKIISKHKILWGKQN
jgi:predicted helicase